MRGHIERHLARRASPGSMRPSTQDWRRVVGAAHFDHVVDFSGYSPAWTFLLGHAPARHPVGVAAQRPARRPDARGAGPAAARGEPACRLHELRPLRPPRVGVARRCVTSTPGRSPQWAPAEKFAAARNTIDVQRIVSGASEDAPEGTFDALRPATDGAELRSSSSRWAGSHPRRTTMRLLEAFQKSRTARTPRSASSSWGTGRCARTSRRSSSGSGSAVSCSSPGSSATRGRSWPRASASCSSSDYEGQPMVILEARTLGLPVVSTSFDSVGSALAPGEGLVVERTVDALAEGMVAAVEGRVPCVDFDVRGLQRARRRRSSSAPSAPRRSGSAVTAARDQPMVSGPIPRRRPGPPPCRRRAGRRSSGTLS